MMHGRKNIRPHGVMTWETTRFTAVESRNLKHEFIVEMVYVAVA